MRWSVLIKRIWQLLLIQRLLCGDFFVQQFSILDQFKHQIQFLFSFFSYLHIQANINSQHCIFFFKKKENPMHSGSCMDFQDAFVEQICKCNIVYCIIFYNYPKIMYIFFPSCRILKFGQLSIFQSTSQPVSTASLILFSQINFIQIREYEVKG